MKNVPYKVVTLSTLLMISAMSIAVPINSFAQEQVQQVNSEVSMAPPKEMEKSLEDLQNFATVMNHYSLMLLMNPDINFGNIPIPNHETLPEEFHKSQSEARDHAREWTDTIKPLLLATTQKIIDYNVTFQNYYSTLMRFAQEDDKPSFIAGVEQLNADIQENQRATDKLITKFTEFKDLLSKDVRNFNGFHDTLKSIPEFTTPDIERDEKVLKDLIENAAYYERVRIAGYSTVWLNVIAGSVMIGVSDSRLGELRPKIAELQKSINERTQLNRNIVAANESIAGLQRAVSDALRALLIMKGQWDLISNQYNDVIKHTQRGTTVPSQFMPNELNIAKKRWDDLQDQVEIINKSIIELKAKKADSVNGNQ